MKHDDTQKVQFLQAEGDAWYRRNREALAAESPLRDSFARRIAAHLPVTKGTPASVLEIGAGDGANLAALARIASVDAHGLEPSAQAVEAGRTANPALHLRCGTADDLPYAAASFDVVWFGFCLYLVDRPLLFRCVSEADRVLRPGGAVAIVDFDPGMPTRRSYHHRPGVWSYKMDYSSLFLAHPDYRLAEKISGSHSELRWADDPQERVALWICRKDPEHAYQTVTS